MGYRIDEVPPIPTGTIDPRCQIIRKFSVSDKRVPVLRSLGPHVKGVCFPCPDPKDQLTTYCGGIKRVCRSIPKMSAKMAIKFRSFVRSYVHHHFKPLSGAEIMSFEEWLSETHYPEWRREQLRQLYQQKYHSFPDKHGRRVNCHIKRETYDQYKHARWIMSRDDHTKCWLGPIIKSIEKKVYHVMGEFIKTVPVDKRPQYIKERLFAPGSNYTMGDFSAYECHFECDYTDGFGVYHPGLRDTVENVLYEYMLRDITRCFSNIQTITDRKNVLEFKNGIMAIIESRRMSGEMNTALGNTFSTAMLHLFMAHLHKCTVYCCVEGDDSVARWTNGFVPTKQDWVEVGIECKMVVVSDSFSKLSFCGITADEIELQNVRDPIVKMCQLSWSTSPGAMFCSKKKSLGYLKAKCLSTIAELPSCPIVTPFCVHVVNQLSSVKADFSCVDAWKLENLDLNVKPIPPGPRTRILVADLFGIPVGVQIDIERFLTSRSLGPIECPYFNRYIAAHYPDACDFYDRFCTIL